MQPLTLEEIVLAIGGRPLSAEAPPPIRVASVGVDSRAVSSDQLFVALKGENFDGHDFVADALTAGAAAALVCRLDSVPESLRHDGRVIVVPDTLAALGQLARYYRRQIATTVIAVVGSNGKTTTKSMIRAVLSAQRQGKMAPRSFNNAIGVPLTLLSADPTDEYLVVEIGTNSPGEVASLARIAQPEIAVVVSLGQEHLEFFDDLEGVAAEELSILAHVSEGGLAVIHDDAVERARKIGAATLKRISFGLGESADLRATDVAMTAEGVTFRLNGRFDYLVPVIGPHNAVNALAAIAVGRRFAMEYEAIADGLRRMSPPPMRMEVRRQNGVTILNDAYNANPTSVRAALATLSAWPDGGRAVALLGDMHELGRHAEACHASVGKDAARSAARLIIAVGRFAESVAEGARSVAIGEQHIVAFATQKQAAAALPGLLRSGDVVLVKGSRASSMERLIESLCPAPKSKARSRRAESAAAASSRRGNSANVAPSAKKRAVTRRRAK